MQKNESKLSYWVKCRNCRYSRGFGFAPLTARTKATSHALRLGHEVEIQKSDLKTLTTESELVSPKVTQEILGDAPF